MATPGEGEAAKFDGTVGGVTSGPIVNERPLLATPPTVTTTFPLLAPVGTTTPILVALQLPATPAETPLNVTVLAPWVDPKLVPVIVTRLPTGPADGLRLAIVGDGSVTVK